MKIYNQMLIACLFLLASPQLFATIMYADTVTVLNRGDTSVGNFSSFYGGNGTEVGSVSLTNSEAGASILGAPDGSFLSLPGGSVPSGTGWPYAYVEVSFPTYFDANVNLVITEIGANSESAHLWVWTQDGGNVQPDVTRNSTGTMLVDLSPFSSFVSVHGLFTRIGIGGWDLLGPSQGFDLDAIGVQKISNNLNSVPEPSSMALMSIGLLAFGLIIKRSCY